MTQDCAIPTALLVTSALVVFAGVWLVLWRGSLKAKEPLPPPVRLANLTNTMDSATRNVPQGTVKSGGCVARSEWKFRILIELTHKKLSLVLISERGGEIILCGALGAPIGFMYENTQRFSLIWCSALLQCRTTLLQNPPASFGFVLCKKNRLPTLVQRRRENDPENQWCPSHAPLILGLLCVPQCCFNHGPVMLEYLLLLDATGMGKGFKNFFYHHKKCSPGLGICKIYSCTGKKSASLIYFGSLLREVPEWNYQTNNCLLSRWLHLA